MMCAGTRTTWKMAHGRCRAWRPLGTAYGLAAWSDRRSTASSMRDAARLQSTGCPQRPRKTLRTFRKGQISCGVSRSPLDNRANTHQGQGMCCGCPHRPQALLILDRFILFFLAFGRRESHRHATLASSPEPYARSPRRALNPLAPTRQNSCRGTRQNNCRCTLPPRASEDRDMADG